VGGEVPGGKEGLERVRQEREELLAGAGGGFRWEERGNPDHQKKEKWKSTFPTHWLSTAQKSKALDREKIGPEDNLGTTRELEAGNNQQFGLDLRGSGHR
jgi:hypothetical protein